MSESDAPAADWYPDPSGRFQFRYWDGETWTGHVSTDGKTDWDPPEDGAPQGSGETADAGHVTAETDEAAQTGEQVTPQAVGQAGVAAQGADDSAWAPQGGGMAVTAQGDTDQAAGAAQPTAAEQPAAPQQPADAGAEQSMAPEEPTDTNLAANRRAGVADDVVSWLDEVAGQVEPRLSRINDSWTAQPQAEAARACAYGLLVGHLARLHPHMRPELGQVAEAHPSFTTLEAGSRLDTLEQIAADQARATAWLGPLIGTEDVERVGMLFD